MKATNLLPSGQKTTGAVRKNTFRQPAVQEASILDEGGLHTTDVTFVTQAARNAAVKKGSGVMIGDYFVGVTTGSDLLFSHPFIVY
jgi:hypothetical protein